MSYALEPLIDELPGTGTVRADFAAVFARTATGPIQHMLGTPRHRANAAVFMQDTGPAGGAFLRPHASFFKNTEELGIETGINRFIGVALGNRLDTRTATQGKHGIAFCDGLGSLLDEDIIALALNGKFINFKGLTPLVSRQCAMPKR